MTIGAARRGVLLICTLAASSACATDPEQAAKRYTESGDAYTAKQQYEEAIIEYRNALQAVPGTAAVRFKLGQAYEESGDPVRAYAEYARAADLDPAHIAAQMRAGTLLLAAREFQAARTRAELALAAGPSHAPAHILLGNALAGLNETAPALRQIEQAIRLDPSYAPAWTALGAVSFVGGRRAEAAAAFEKAVALAPSSVDARLALANYRWASGAVLEAEVALKAALALEPANASAHRTLALLYVTTRRVPEAEQHFRALATDAQGELALADYLMGSARNAEALTVLEPLARSTDTAAARDAVLRISSIHYGSGNKAEGHRLVDGLIAERPRNADARTAKARMLLSDGGSAADAVTHAREAVKADQSSVAAQYTLGLTYLAARNPLEAERAFEAAVRLSPRATAAQMRLAKLRLARGEIGGAVSAAEIASRSSPADTDAAVLLAQSLRAQGEIDRAAKELRTRLAADPSSMPLHLEMGWLSLQRDDPKTARASFGEALRITPQSLEARHGLIATDVSQGQIDAARARLAEWLRNTPDDQRIRVLEGRLHLSAGDPAAAMVVLKRVIAIDPAQLDAYELLGRALTASGQVDEAIAQYQALAERSPEAATGARTLAAMLDEARGDRAAALTTYERVMAEDPKAGVAANNLAWLYVQDGKLEDALRMAQVAQDALRRRPEAEDTLGWVYLQKGLLTQAIAAFERARERAPQNPVYLYHLGLAHHKNGDRARARASFSKALALAPDFNGATDARAQLAELSDAGAAPSTTAR